MKHVYAFLGAVGLLPAGALAADARPGDKTDASVAALRSTLGDARGLEIDEVRVTDDGVACIEYRLPDAQGRLTRGHAVVRDQDVLRSPPDDGGKFEKAWTDHCLGPRGGVTSEQ